MSERGESLVLFFFSYKSSIFVIILIFRCVNLHNDKELQITNKKQVTKANPEEVGNVNANELINYNANENSPISAGGTHTDCKD